MFLIYWNLVKISLIPLSLNLSRTIDQLNQFLMLPIALLKIILLGQKNHCGQIILREKWFLIAMSIMRK